MNAEDMIERLSGRLSLRRRIGTVAAMLGGLTMAAVVGLLWATEPGLPAHTRVAFGGIVLAGLAWGAYGIWVLTRRMPLLALDRVIAAWLGLAATFLLAGYVAVVATVQDRGGPAGVVVAVVLAAVAVVNLVRARAHRAALLRRRRELDESGGADQRVPEV
jgi:hypothetical protein